MVDKKYDPSWSGYMGDYLRGNISVNKLKPQHEFFDAIGLIRFSIRTICTWWKCVFHYFQQGSKG